MSITMISIKEKLPLDNAICDVKFHIPNANIKLGPWRFVRCSDGGWFWDNCVDEILQDYEVTHWEYTDEKLRSEHI